MSKLPRTDSVVKGETQENSKSEFQSLTAAEYLRRWRLRNPERRRAHNHEYYQRRKLREAGLLPPAPRRLRRVLEETEILNEAEALATAQAIDQAARRERGAK
jgi:hypothetical protein